MWVNASEYHYAQNGNNHEENQPIEMKQKEKKIIHKNTYKQIIICNWLTVSFYGICYKNKYFFDKQFYFKIKHINSNSQSKVLQLLIILIYYNFYLPQKTILFYLSVNLFHKSNWPGMKALRSILAKSRTIFSKGTACCKNFSRHFHSNYNMKLFIWKQGSHKYLLLNTTKFQLVIFALFNYRWLELNNITFWSLK